MNDGEENTGSPSEKPVGGVRELGRFDGVVGLVRSVRPYGLRYALKKVCKYSNKPYPPDLRFRAW